MTPHDKQLGMFLWYMATNECYRTLADRWDQTESVVSVSINRVAEAILSQQNNLITWPKGINRKRVVAGFAKKRGTENVVGVIDDSHIRISSQTFCKENYINRKGFPSIIL